jgi:hypothetical protein
MKKRQQAVLEQDKEMAWISTEIDKSGYYKFPPNSSTFSPHSHSSASQKSHSFPFSLIIIDIPNNIQ